MRRATQRGVILPLAPSSPARSPDHPTRFRSQLIGNLVTNTLEVPDVTGVPIGCRVLTHEVSTRHSPASSRHRCGNPAISIVPWRVKAPLVQAETSRLIIPQVPACSSQMACNNSIILRSDADPLLRMATESGTHHRSVVSLERGVFDMYYHRRTRISIFSRNLPRAVQGELVPLSQGSR